MAFFNVVPFVLMQRVAADAGITSPDRQNFYGFMGGVLGSSAVGLGMTAALAKREADQTPSSVQVMPLTITTPQLLPPATNGQAYSTTLTATGGTGAYTWTLTAGALPSSGNIKFDPATGRLSGTPDSSGKDNGFYGLTIQVSDSATPKPATQTQFFVLNIAGATAPVLPPATLSITTPPNLPPAKRGIAYRTALQATGGTPPLKWTLTGGALPASGNLTLSPDGVISGKPDKTGGDDGVYAIVVDVSDSATAPVTQRGVFSLTIGP